MTPFGTTINTYTSGIQTPLSAQAISSAGSRPTTSGTSTNNHSLSHSSEYTNPADRYWNRLVDKDGYLLKSADSQTTTPQQSETNLSTPSVTASRYGRWTSAARSLYSKYSRFTDTIKSHLPVRFVNGSESGSSYLEDSMSRDSSWAGNTILSSSGWTRQ